jgi:hypothetical protein
VHARIKRRQRQQRHAHDENHSRSHPLNGDFVNHRGKGKHPAGGKKIKVGGKSTTSRSSGKQVAGGGTKRPRRK